MPRLCLRTRCEIRSTVSQGPAEETHGQIARSGRFGLVGVTTDFCCASDPTECGHDELGQSDSGRIQPEESGSVKKVLVPGGLRRMVERCRLLIQVSHQEETSFNIMSC